MTARPTVDSNGRLGNHGTHVGGIAAAIVMAVRCTAWRSTRKSSAPTTATQARKTALFAATTARCTRPGGTHWSASGARIINNSWGIGITDRFDLGGRDPAYPHFTFKDAQLQFNEIQQMLGTARRRLSGRH